MGLTDEPIELPEGWVWTALAEIAAIKGGIAKGKKRRSTEKLRQIPYLRVANVQRGFLDLEEISLIEATESEIEALRLQQGDVLFNEGGDRDKLGRGWVWDSEIKECIHQNHVFRARPYLLELQSKYLSLYGNTHGQKYFLSEGKQTTNLASINLTKLSNLPIPLPPLNEQRRIVEAIDQLRDRSQKARSALSAIPALCDQFRQSVLAAAFRGDLTADWREQNPDIEPASVLLERIKEKRLSEAKTDRQRETIEEIYVYEEEYGTEIVPDDWQYTALEKLCCSFQYGTSAKSLPEGRVPVLRMGNLQNGEIDWGNLAFTNDDDEVSKYTLKAGDVLFNRTNSPELVGKTSIYRGEQPAIFAGYLIKINNAIELNSDFLNYCLNSNYARAYCWSVKTDGVSQSNINAQKLAKFEIPFCSLEEQQEIANQIHSLFKVIDQIEQQYREAELYLSQLDRAILAKAFRGELVEQDPTDEPAALLLQRIQAERQTSSKPAKSRKRKATDPQQMDLLS